MNVPGQKPGAEPEQIPKLNSNPFDFDAFMTSIEANQPPSNAP